MLAQTISCMRKAAPGDLFAKPMRFQSKKPVKSQHGRLSRFLAPSVGKLVEIGIDKPQPDMRIEQDYFRHSQSSSSTMGPTISPKILALLHNPKLYNFVFFSPKSATGPKAQPAPIVANAAAHAADGLFRKRSKTIPTARGPRKAAPNPSVEWTASVAPRPPAGELITAPAVREAESATTKTPYKKPRQTTRLYGRGAERPTATLSNEDPTIMRAMVLFLPKRRHSSFPPMLAGSPTRLISAATRVGLKTGVATPCKFALKARKATIHDRIPNNSHMCAAYPKI